MSKNNKNAKRLVAAREMSKLRQSGGNGPKATTPVHGKKKAWFQLFDTHREFLASKNKKQKPARAEQEAA